jgi:hypothetical protein
VRNEHIVLAAQCTSHVEQKFFKIQFLLLRTQPKRWLLAVCAAGDLGFELEISTLFAMPGQSRSILVVKRTEKNH